MRNGCGSEETNWGVFSTPASALKIAKKHTDALDEDSWFVVCMEVLDADPMEQIETQERRGIQFSIDSHGLASAKYQPAYGKWYIDHSEDPNEPRHIDEILAEL